MQTKNLESSEKMHFKLVCWVRKIGSATPHFWCNPVYGKIPTPLIRLL